MQFAVEAWDPDYGTGGDVDALDASTDVVDATVERALGDWAPIAPSEPPASGVIYFVDGVRRIDARIWVTDEGRVLPGSCATVAAGAVACSPGSAVVSDVQVQRAVFTPPAASAGPITTDVGEFVHVPIKTGSPEDLYLGIHETMTDLETRTVPTAEWPSNRWCRNLAAASVRRCSRSVRAGSPGGVGICDFQDRALTVGPASFVSRWQREAPNPATT